MLLSLTACKQQPMGEAKTFTLDDFKTIELKASDATVYQNDDLLLGNPSLIKYHPDGYILLADRKPEGLVTAIDMQTNKINYYVKKGRGPLEVANIKDLCIKNGDIWLSSPNDKKLLRLECVPAQRSFSIKQEGKVDGMISAIFEYFVKNPDKISEEYKRYLEEYSTPRVVCDYIAGMTDRYAIDLYTDLYIPKVWRGGHT